MKNEAKELGQLFENNFDCYADVDREQSCLPNWYKDENTMAMTKEKFIEVVSELCKGKPDSDNTSKLNIDGVNILAKFSKKISQQSDCPAEFTDIVNKEFWNLI